MLKLNTRNNKPCCSKCIKNRFCDKTENWSRTDKIKCFNSEGFDFLIVPFLSSSEIKKIRRWRNHPKINNCMVHQHYISNIEHSNWVEGLALDIEKENPSRLSYTVFEKKVSLGVVNFNYDDKKKTAGWGIYLNPGLKQSGVGLNITHALFNKMWELFPDLKRVEAQILVDNIPSKYLHRMMGFQKKEESSKLIFYTLTKENFID